MKRRLMSASWRIYRRLRRVSGAAFARLRSIALARAWKLIRSAARPAYAVPVTLHGSRDRFAYATPRRVRSFVRHLFS